MAGAGRQTTGLLPRLGQYGLDKIIDHFQNFYKGEADSIFKRMSTEKGFFEMIELSGTGIAGIKGEGDVITYDTMNQEFNKIYPVYTYSKSARMTMESMEDNLYQSLLERFGQQLVKAHAVNDDFQGVSIFNNATTTTWMDGSTLLSTSHKVARGGTNSNRLSPDLDLSADAIEQAIILLHQFLNPDGILGD